MLREKMPLKVHLMMCSACNNFKLQMPFLSQAMRSFSQWEGVDADDNIFKTVKPSRQDNLDK
ncbi:hypothetical protein HC248_00860 [Polaromonas vacuolata]|uniref:Uncharacterized protein n=2 Tax=Polaromonas vacuolata TaxID=37448 RepID=A0A6H2H6U0_9BURK|nr:hypothetical protein HC248_00860 [Polaromonas vacuolata]